jgi:hypothetical protein
MEFNSSAPGDSDMFSVSDDVKMFSEALDQTEGGNSLTVVFSGSDEWSESNNPFGSLEFIPSASFNTSEVFTMSNEFLMFLKIKPVEDSVLGYVLASIVLAGMFIGAYGRLLYVEMALDLRAQQLKRAEERRQKRLDEQKAEEEREQEELRRLEEEEKKRVEAEKKASLEAEAAAAAAAQIALEAEELEDFDPFMLDDEDYWGDEFYLGDETVEERRERLEKEAKDRFANMTPEEKRIEMQRMRRKMERDIARRSKPGGPSHTSLRTQSKFGTLWQMAQSKKRK